MDPSSVLLSRTLAARHRDGSGSAETTGAGVMRAHQETREKTMLITQYFAKDLYRGKTVFTKHLAMRPVLVAIWALSSTCASHIHAGGSPGSSGASPARRLR